MSSNQAKLNSMNPSADYAQLGKKIDQIITLLIELQPLFNAHSHAALGAVPSVLLTSPAPDPLD